VHTRHGMHELPWTINRLIHDSNEDMWLKVSFSRDSYSTDVNISLHYIAVQHSKTALIPKSNLTQSKQKTPNPTFAQTKYGKFYHAKILTTAQILHKSENVTKTTHLCAFLARHNELSRTTPKPSNCETWTDEFSCITAKPQALSNISNLIKNYIPYYKFCPN